VVLLLLLVEEYRYCTMHLLVVQLSFVETNRLVVQSYVAVLQLSFVDTNQNC